MPSEVLVLNHSRAKRVDRAAVESLVRDLNRKTGAASDAGCSIVFVSDRRMRELNGRFRGKDSTTDVLSFPTSDTGEYLGDIVISLPRALAQAAEIGRPAADEVRLLVIHGFLHLLGYDHEQDKGEMLRLQARLDRALSGCRPLIGRSRGARAA